MTFEHNNVNLCRHKLSEQNFENVSMGSYFHKKQKLITKISGLATSFCHNSAMIKHSRKFTSN